MAGLASLSPTQAALTYSGGDGTIEYDWQAPQSGSVNSLGTIHIQTRLDHLPNADIQLSPTIITPWTDTSVPAGTQMVFRSSSLSTNTTGAVWTLSYQAASLTVNISLQFTLNGRALNVLCSASQPVLNAINLGAWPATSRPQSIPVPYFPTNPPVYLQANNLFALAYFDWHMSKASWFDDTGTQAVYWPLTNGQPNTVSEKLVVSVAANLTDVFPDLNNQASPYISELAGKTVLDIWNNGFDNVRASLERLAPYGLDNCVVLLHNWQYYGYDNALPEHTPANPVLGGDAALASLAREAKTFGCRFALHENYVNYYPNYPGFSGTDVALTTTGGRLRSWLNPSTGIQAYVSKPAAMLTHANQQSPIIKRAYESNSSFIDVNSAAPPWLRADMDSTSKGAGQFVSYTNANSALWSFARNLYQGPVFGEGGHHSSWSGMLDGVEAQFGSGGVPENSGSQAPLLVDFDLNKVHPLQVNHGMGYYERWVGAGDNMRNTGTLDSYRMQEVIFGHSPFLGATLWSNPARWFVERNLTGTVSQRYGNQSVVSTQYQFKGNWTDLNTASKAGTWNRVQVKYSNGDVIVANGADQPMSWLGYTLPPNGWIATGSGLLAYTSLKNGVVVDYAETSDSVFANARNPSDLQTAGALARVAGSDFTQPAQNVFTFSLTWSVLDYSRLSDLFAFVHFVSPSASNSESIAFQCGHALSFPDSAWRPGALLKDMYSCYLSSTQDGTYAVSVGMVLQSNGNRQMLAGINDGKNRFVVGQLTVSQNGTRVSFSPTKSQVSTPPDIRMNMAGTVIDFNTVRTDGMLSLRHDAYSGPR